MRHGEFDSDATALESRIRSHEKFGSRDLNEWIFSIVAPREGETILDLGSGTGKQSIPLAQKVGPEGSVLSLDVSQEALDLLQSRAVAAGVHDRIRTVCVMLDDLATHLEGLNFDHVIACYSIYYVSDAKRLFSTVREHISPGGSLFFCGPTGRNNAEIINFHHQVSGSGEASPGTADQFMEGTGPQLAREFFGEVETHYFENQIRYDSVDGLLSYWSSYNLYDPTLEEAFKAAASRHISEHGFFETVKRVVGIKAIRV